MSIKLSDQHVPVAKMRPREYIKNPWSSRT